MFGEEPRGHLSLSVGFDRHPVEQDLADIAMLGIPTDHG